LTIVPELEFDGKKVSAQLSKRATRSCAPAPRTVGECKIPFPSFVDIVNNRKMLNDKQREIFSRLLDVNYEMKRESDVDKKLDLLNQVSLLKQELKEDMGEESYTRFMNMGARMFRPKDQDLSDSFSEGIYTNTAAEEYLKKL
jgi:hypothetical protein